MWCFLGYNFSKGLCSFTATQSYEGVRHYNTHIMLQYYALPLPFLGMVHMDYEQKPFCLFIAKVIMGPKVMLIIELSMI